MRVEKKLSRIALGALLALWGAGCSSSNQRPTDAETARDASLRSCAGPTDELDLLFVIENAGGMSEEQASLIQQLPRLMRALTRGELRDTSGALLRSGTPVTSLHVGVVDSDMGVGGAIVPTCTNARFGDDGLLQTRGDTAIVGCAAGYPAFLGFSASDDTEALASDVSCVLAGVGTDGCAMERHLGAMLKAVTPEDSPLRFAEGTQGHADVDNAGFLRPDSVLAVVVLAEEDDCDAARADLFNSSSATYTGDLNIRCASYPEALHPISRYVDGLLALRPERPERLVYSAIAGVPTDLVADADTLNYDAILADPRMQQRPDLSRPWGLTPSCNVPGRGLAFPPVRLTQLARDLDDAGAHAVVQSMCQEDFSEPVNAILNQIFDATEGGCRR